MLPSWTLAIHVFSLGVCQMDIAEMAPLMQEKKLMNFFLDTTKAAGTAGFLFQGFQAFQASLPFCLRFSWYCQFFIVFFCPWWSLISQWVLQWLHISDSISLLFPVDGFPIPISCLLSQTTACLSNHLSPWNQACSALWAFMQTGEKGSWHKC